ncbi:MAG: vanadium-dependent haloperoxidase [Pyrinomonadaceae bacterium]
MSKNPPSSRRQFLGRVGSATAATIAAGTIGFEPLMGALGTGTAKAQDGEKGQDPEGSISPRATQAYNLRVAAALAERDLPEPVQTPNSDETLYANKIGSYSKGLPHNNLGEVEVSAYNAMVNAMNTGVPADFEAIPLGAGSPALQRKLVNPQSGLAFDMEGTDSHHLAIPPAPAFNSAWQAGEIGENYWMAVLRDVPFANYATDPLVAQACTDLSNFSDFRGPKIGGQVTPGTLFRGLTPGDLVGPYISQFLYKNVPFGATGFSNRMYTLLPGVDYLTNYNDWLEIQRGSNNVGQPLFDQVPRYVRNGRDLAQWVHVDVLFQAYFQAMLILLQPPNPSDPISGGGIGATFDAGNPYLSLLTQDAFGTFGGPHVATMLCEPSTRALKGIWYQKWGVHRRLRPEAMAGRIHNHLTGAASYPIHADILNSTVLSRLKRIHRSFLLPMVFPEGSPMHPSYGAGHATVAGACTTFLKAFFDESFVISNPVVPDASGANLVPYSGPPLTVGNELNKLAANVAIGRNHAGVHYRTDYTESIKLGEAITISMLRDQKSCYNEPFTGFSLTKFDGTTIVI